MISELERVFDRPNRDATYLLLSVLTFEVPLVHEVVAAFRRWKLDGTTEWIAALARAAVDYGPTPRPECEIRGGVVVDVTDTVASSYVTGIQRVVREVVKQWAARPDVITVAWDPSRRRLQEVSLDHLWIGGCAMPLVVPFRGSLVLLEIAVEGARAARLASIAAHSSRAVAVGHDCIPLTTAETSGSGMPGAFAKYLAALTSFDEVVTTSAASEAEFRGWVQILGMGARAPEISRISLAYTTDERANLLVQSNSEAPLVLVVGSHEPRKNHLRLLDAAARLWAEGATFEMVMVGANSWDAEDFTATVEGLNAAGRSIAVLPSASDQELWDLYQRAHFTVFVSVNEGFGLPIVESISRGTPVVTSSFGSMAELGQDHGALLVDPRDPRSILDAMRSLLDDARSRDELMVASQTLETRNWADYATELWARLGQ